MNADLSSTEWKREVHRYIDEQIDKHNDANERRFQQLRDGQLKIETDIDDLDKRLTAEIRSVRTASETSHAEIIKRLERIESQLSR